MSENQTPEEQISQQPDAEETAEGFVMLADIGSILNANDIQYTEIQNQFNIVKKPEGWLVTIGENETKVTFNLKSMRKIEYTLHPGDTIEKENDDIFILRKLTDEEKEHGGTLRRAHASSYRSRRQASRGETTE